MPPIKTADALVESVRSCQLLDAQRLQELKRLSAKVSDLRPLAKEAVQRGWLTPFQVNQLLQGNGSSLVLGQYVLLERIGEGGMGQVYKARQSSLDRIVALKVVSPEHVSNVEAVRRFYREIRAVAQLSHPNVVMAFDAAQVGKIHYFAMEYVDGIDLSNLVKTRGPLPVRDACEAIRQAALGLQHAHERGLIHRDIKPSNLLRSNQGGLVKLLDLGLARLHEGLDGDGLNQNGSEGASAGLTKLGKAIGTPDYMAPEQARNSHSVDGRADIYSLGCTFYFLLAGRVPFSGGNAVEKMLKHQLDTATPIEKLRPEVPAALGAIVRKLMAKQPEERYQTPGELAKVLEPWCRRGKEKGSDPRTTTVIKYPVMAAAMTQPGAAPAAPPPPPAPAPAEKKKKRKDTGVRWSKINKPTEGDIVLLPAQTPRKSPAPLIAAVVGIVVAGSLLLYGVSFMVSGISEWMSSKPRSATGPSGGPGVGRPMYLSDLQEQGVTVGVLSKFGKNGELGYRDRRIVVDGVPALKGIGLLSTDSGTAQVTYPLARQYAVFKASAAINDRYKDEPDLGDGVTFAVHGDGKLLWKSRPLQHYGESEAFSVSVAGIERIKLSIEGPRGKIPAVWVDPQLFKN